MIMDEHQRQDVCFSYTNGAQLTVRRRANGGVLVRLASTSDDCLTIAMGREPAAEMCRYILDTPNRPPQQKTPESKYNKTGAVIIATVAQVYHMTVDDLLELDRDKDRQAARRMCWCFLDRYTYYSQSDIARIFGRSRETVCHGIHAALTSQPANLLKRGKLERIITQNLRKAGLLAHN
jgi:hypothetical protein